MLVMTALLLVMTALLLLVMTALYHDGSESPGTALVQQVGLFVFP